MNPRLRRRLPRCIDVATLLLGGAAALLCIRILYPAPAWRPPASDPTIAATAKTPSNPPLQVPDLAVIWQRDLRQALFDSPPAAPPSEPPLTVHLEGTVIESARRFGLFRLADGRRILQPVGGRIEGLEVVAIERGLARLNAGEREYTLTVPRFDRIRAADGGAP